MNIDFDSENTELEIKTKIQPESVKIMKIQFLGDKQDEDPAAGFTLKLKPSQTYTYRIWMCLNLSRTGKYFPTDLPISTEKVWRIRRISKERRLVIHCNDIEVLNFVVSGTTCDDPAWSTSQKRWEKKVVKIRFPGTDTASEFYRSSPSTGKRFV